MNWIFLKLILMPLTEEQKQRKREYNKKYYEKNKEKEALRNKKYRENNKEKEKLRSKKYRENNKEKQLKKNKKYFQTENGKKVSLKSSWKSRGVNMNNFEEFYKIYIETTNCDICDRILTNGNPITETTKCLDHCHITGDFRCILCNSCNLRRI